MRIPVRIAHKELSLKLDWKQATVITVCRVLYSRKQISGKEKLAKWKKMKRVLMLEGPVNRVPRGDRLEVGALDVVSADLGADIHQFVIQGASMKFVFKRGKGHGGAIFGTYHFPQHMNHFTLAVLSWSEEKETLFIIGVPGEAVTEKLLHLKDNLRRLHRLFKILQPSNASRRVVRFE
jgi:hypothetical protein